MEMAATPGIFESFVKAVATLLALFASPAAPLAKGQLPMELVATSERLLIIDPVEFEISMSENGPTVFGEFSATDATRFSDFTERHIGENVGFVVCGQEIMAPRILIRIEGGQFLISSPESNETMVGFLENGCP